MDSMVVVSMFWLPDCDASRSMILVVHLAGELTETKWALFREPPAPVQGYAVSGTLLPLHALAELYEQLPSASTAADGWEGCSPGPGRFLRKVWLTSATWLTTHRPMQMPATNVTVPILVFALPGVY